MTTENPRDGDAVTESALIDELAEIFTNINILRGALMPLAAKRRAITRQKNRADVLATRLKQLSASPDGGAPGDVHAVCTKK